MGFIFDNTASSSTTNGMMSATSGASLVAGTPLSATIPATVHDGDLLIAVFGSVANPTVAWSTPSGWSALAAQKNMSASVGGRAAYFQKVWHTGDSLTVASSGPGGNSVAVVIIVHSDTAGGSLTIGNPPSSGFAGTYSVENTVAGTTITVPTIAVDSSTRDLRIVIGLVTGSNAAVTTPNIASSAENLSGADARQLLGLDVGSTIGVFVSMFLLADPAGSEVGSSTWTTASAKSYSVCFAVHDPSATIGGTACVEEVLPLEAVVPISAIGLEHITTVTQAGGGGSITVF